MSNLPLVAGIVTSIDSIPMLTTTKVSIKRMRKVTKKFGPTGPIGTAVGPYQITAVLTFAVPVAGIEIDIDSLSARPGGFSFNFSKGARRYLVTGCQLSEDSIDNDPENADTNNQVTIEATDMVRTA
jgi:hypothetical protein